MNISEYIHSKESLELVPFMAVYQTILELAKDGYVKLDENREMVKINGKIQSKSS